MAVAVTRSKSVECKSLDCERHTKYLNCVKCLYLELRLKETVDELNSARAILELFMKDLVAETVLHESRVMIS
jgi:hypothetical protein